MVNRCLSSLLGSWNISTYLKSRKNPWKSVWNIGFPNRFGHHGYCFDIFLVQSILHCEQIQIGSPELANILCGLFHYYPGGSIADIYSRAFGLATSMEIDSCSIVSRSMKISGTVLLVKLF